jgi:hypothetical protein
MKVSRLWSFLNSKFGLWLLSSVVLTAITYGYTTYCSYLDAEKSKRLLQDKLVYTIQCNLWEFEGTLGHINTFISYSDAFSKNLQKGVPKFNDLKDATLDELLWLLRRDASRQQTHRSYVIQDGIKKIWEIIEPARVPQTLTISQKHDIDEAIRRVYTAYHLSDINKI